MASSKLSISPDIVDVDVAPLLFASSRSSSPSSSSSSTLFDDPVVVESLVPAAALGVMTIAFVGISLAEHIFRCGCCGNGTFAGRTNGAATVETLETNGPAKLQFRACAGGIIIGGGCVGMNPATLEGNATIAGLVMLVAVVRESALPLLSLRARG